MQVRSTGDRKARYQPTVEDGDDSELEIGEHDLVGGVFVQKDGVRVTGLTSETQTTTSAKMGAGRGGDEGV